MQPRCTLRDIVQPRCNLQDIVQPRCNLRDIVQPRCTLRDIVQPRCTLRDIVQPRCNLQDIVQPRCNLQDIVQPRDTVCSSMVFRFILSVKLYIMRALMLHDNVEIGDIRTLAYLRPFQTAEEIFLTGQTNSRISRNFNLKFK